MDTAQWPQQEIVLKPMEEIVTNSCTKPGAAAVDQRKPRPQKEQALNCPRCNSTNTKFCYYNNYSLTQPRYFCKTCRRYWTEGGSLRNIPVGGGSRKNRRSAASSSSPNSSCITGNKSLKLPDLIPPPPPPCSQATTNTTHLPNIHDQGQDLNLGFPTQDFRTIPADHAAVYSHIPSSSTTSPASSSHNQHHLSALELLTGFTSRGLNSFGPMSIPADHSAVFSATSSGFPMQEFKPSLNFSLDGSLGNGYGGGSLQGSQDATRRPAFAFEDLKQVSNAGDVEQNNREQPADSTGYWTGMIGGGSW